MNIHFFIYSFLYIFFLLGNSQNGNISKRTENVYNIMPPTPFMTEEEFFKTWYIWKNDFLLFKRALIGTNSNKQQWGNMLLNLMGPIGQNIHSAFIFDTPNDKENINILIQKFDEYYIFSGKKKLPLENVYEYINELEVDI